MKGEEDSQFTLVSERDLATLKAQSSRLETVENQLNDTEEALGIALHDKNDLETENARLQALLQEKELTYSDNLLEKDIQIVDLQLENKVLMAARDSLNKNKDLFRTQSLKLEEYKKCLDAVKNWGILTFVELAKSTRILEEEKKKNDERTTTIENLQNQVVNLKEELNNTQNFLASHYSIEDEASEFEQALLTECTKAYQKLKIYSTAFEQIKKLFIESRANSEDRIQQQKLRVVELQRKIDSYATMARPQWEGETRIHDTEKSVHLYAEKLKCRNLYVSNILLDTQKQVFYMNPFPEISRSMQLYDSGITTLRLIYKVDSLLHFLFVINYKQIVRDIQKGSSLVSKDQCFVLWLHSTITVLCELQSSLCMVLEATRKISVPELEKFMLGSPKNRNVKTDNLNKLSDNELKELKWFDIVKSGEEDINLLINLSINIALTPSFDTSVLERIVQRVKRCWEEFENSYQPKPHQMKGTAKLEDLKFTKLKPPILLATLRRLNSLSILGLCNLSSCNEAVKEISPSIWAALYDGTSYLFKRIPFGYAFTEENVVSVSEKNVLTFGFGNLLLSRRQLEFLNDSEFSAFLNQTADSLQSMLFCSSPIEVTNLANDVKDKISRLGEALKTIESSCSSFVAPFTVEGSTVWESLLERALSLFHEIDFLNKNLETSEALSKQKDAKIESLEQEISQLSQSLKEWKNKFAQAQYELEKLNLNQTELREKRAREVQYSQILLSQTQKLKVLEEEKQQLGQENAEYKSKIQDMRCLLEEFKQLPEHVGQSANWIVRELKNLKLINKKLQTELVSVQMESAKQWLNSSDIHSEGCTADNANEIFKNKAKLKSYALWKDFWNLRRELFAHLICVPIPTKDTTPEETRAQWKAYTRTGASLSLNLNSLKMELEKELLQSSNVIIESKDFGPFSLLNHPEWRFLMDIRSSLTNFKDLPLSMKILTSEPPAWLGEEAVSTYQVVCTPLQFHALRQMLFELTSEESGETLKHENPL